MAAYLVYNIRKINIIVLVLCGFLLRCRKKIKKHLGLSLKIYIILDEVCFGGVYLVKGFGDSFF